MIPLITIEGATAVGKTALALALAEALQTTIISADSRQVYRKLDIATAKASKAERARVQHHLIDIIDPDQTYNAGLFLKDASKIVAHNSKTNKLSLVCGGTGLYIKTLLEGIFEHGEIKAEIRDQLKQRLIDDGIDELYRDLSSVDPLFASQISSSDTQRILRGLEVFQATGKPMTTHWTEQKRETLYKPFRILIDLDRTILYSRINARVNEMLDMGLLDEINQVLAEGFDSNSPGLNTLGYREFIPYIEGVNTLEDCSLLTAQRTRNYAKRQVTWYKKCDFDLTITSQSISLSTVINRIHDKFGDLI